jgi:HPt (histidine-containing phosphotransfer) domain-containing protein
MSTTTDPLDRSQIKQLLSLDDGAGDALAEIVEEFRTVSWQGRDDLRRELREGDRKAFAYTAHWIMGASENVGAHDLAQVCTELERHARQKEPGGADERAETDGLMERFETEFTRVHIALMLLVPEN